MTSFEVTRAVAAVVVGPTNEPSLEIVHPVTGQAGALIDALLVDENPLSRTKTIRAFSGPHLDESTEYRDLVPVSIRLDRKNRLIDTVIGRTPGIDPHGNVIVVDVLNDQLSAEELGDRLLILALVTALHRVEQHGGSIVECDDVSVRESNLHTPTPASHDLIPREDGRIHPHLDFAIVDPLHHDRVAAVI